MKTRHGKLKQSAANYWVLNRDNFQCLYCGVDAKITEVALVIDHIRPVAHGGTGSLNNLAAVCYACNLRKGSKVFDSISESILSYRLKERNSRIAESELLEVQEIMDKKHELREVRNELQKRHQRWNDKAHQTISLSYFIKQQ